MLLLYKNVGVVIWRAISYSLDILWRQLWGRFLWSQGDIWGRTLASESVQGWLQNTRTTAVTPELRHLIFSTGFW